MKIIAIGAVTAGGKTTLVNAIKDKLTRTASLHFDDYSFDGEVNDFYNKKKSGEDMRRGHKCYAHLARKKCKRSNTICIKKWQKQQKSLFFVSN